MGQLNYGQHYIDDEDIEQVVSVLKSGALTQGPTVPAFEKKLCDYTGTKFCTVVNSATSALHLSCIALKISPGDLIWTSPNSFVASANAALYCGGNIDFVDVDVNTFNISVSLLEKKLHESSKVNRLPKALIVVHFAGAPSELSSIWELCKSYGVKLIEDASHALGATYKSNRIGSCSFSDLCVFSFHPVKMITSGEGGAVLTNSASLDFDLKLNRSHGVTKEEKNFTKVSDGIWDYQQISMGYNYRMSDIHAALGLSQLEKIDQFVAERKKAAAYYDHLIDGEKIVHQEQRQTSVSSYHLYVINIKAGQDLLFSQRMFAFMRENGVNLAKHYKPIHLQPYYRNLGFEEGMFKNSENYYLKTFSLPLFVGLSESMQQNIIDFLYRGIEKWTS